jgi:hypothetical protein
VLGTIHVTFAMCSANGRVLAAIDLDNDRSLRAARCRSSSRCWRLPVRYLRCPADHLPSIPELQLLVPQQRRHGRGPQPRPR